MLNEAMLTAPSTLFVPVSKLPVLLVLSSATVTVSLASVKSSLTGDTVNVNVAVC